MRTKESEKDLKSVNLLNQIKNEQVKSIRESLLVITCPEIYYVKPTSKQEEDAEKKYRNLYVSGKNRIPNGVNTYYGKLMFTEHDDNFLFLLTPVLGANKTVQELFALIFELREEAIKKLMDLSPEGIAKLRVKATKLQALQPSIHGNLIKH